MDTNLRYVPQNITSQLSTHNQYNNDNYYILLGIDIDYPNQDPYSIANAEYIRVRTKYIGGALLHHPSGRRAVSDRPVYGALPASQL